MVKNTGVHGFRRDIATVCLSGTLEDKLTAAAAAGFDGVEIFENDLIGSFLSSAEVRSKVAELGLSIDLYQPFRDAEGTPPDRWAGTLRRAKHKLDVMAGLGADTILLCSSVAPDAVDDDDLAAAQLSQLADLAADRGLRLAYEALAWGRHVSTWEHSWRIVSRANHPALGLCLDSFHIYSRQNDVQGIADLPGDKIFFVQLADAPALSMDVLQWSRHHRVFPGQGAFDLVAFVAAVLRTGYDGPLSLEVFNDLFRQSKPDRTAVDAMRSLVDLEDRVAQHLQAADEPTRCVPAPRAPDLHEHAFTELTVDDISGPQVAGTLQALGFVHTGEHRSKPVQLWEQSAARVVLVSTGTPSEQGHGSASVHAIAVSSADPSESAVRAAAMLAAPLPRRRGPAEVVLHAVSAPDGTELIFCPSPASGRGDWREDFLPTGGTRQESVGLLRTDHVAVAQPFDYFDEAGLFYRSVLGLADAVGGEFAAPYGLVRTLAESDRDGLVRIALSSTLLRRGEWAPVVADPQHIAFACDNIIETADALIANRAPILPIPHNYYEDLAARTAMSDERIAALEVRGILYDRDATGEFLQLFTHMLGGRLFFEVVQRIGAYEGYGDLNAPVQMAAHRHLRLHAAS